MLIPKQELIQGVLRRLFTVTSCVNLRLRTRDDGHQEDFINVFSF